MDFNRSAAPVVAYLWNLCLCWRASDQMTSVSPVRRKVYGGGELRPDPKLPQGLSGRLFGWTIQKPASRGNIHRRRKARAPRSSPVPDALGARLAQPGSISPSAGSADAGTVNSATRGVMRTRICCHLMAFVEGDFIISHDFSTLMTECNEFPGVVVGHARRVPNLAIVPV